MVITFRKDRLTLKRRNKTAQLIQVCLKNTQHNIQLFKFSTISLLLLMQYFMQKQHRDTMNSPSGRAGGRDKILQKTIYHLFRLLGSQRRIACDSSLDACNTPERQDYLNNHLFLSEKITVNEFWEMGEV